MQISLFVCNAERNRVNKGAYLSNRYVVDGNIKTATSVTNPIITISRSNFIPYMYNYMYIEEFARYYFIDDVVNVQNRVWEIQASCDVLYSFASDIGNSEAVIDKAENTNDANLYLNDGSFITDVRKDIEVKEFSSGFNTNGSYVLICAGGV